MIWVVEGRGEEVGEGINRTFTMRDKGGNGLFTQISLIFNKGHQCPSKSKDG